MSAEPGFKPRAAGWEARMLPLCYAARLHHHEYRNVHTDGVGVAFVDVIVVVIHDDKDSSTINFNFDEPKKEKNNLCVC